MFRRRSAIYNICSRERNTLLEGSHKVTRVAKRSGPTSYNAVVSECTATPGSLLLTNRLDFLHFITTQSREAKEQRQRQLFNKLKLSSVPDRPVPPPARAQFISAQVMKTKKSPLTAAVGKSAQPGTPEASRRSTRIREMKESQELHTQEEPETRQRTLAKETLKNGRSGSRKGSANGITKISKTRSARKTKSSATRLAEAAENEQKPHGADNPSSPNVAPANLETAVEPYSSENELPDIPREDQQTYHDQSGLSTSQVRTTDSDPSAPRHYSQYRHHHRYDGSKPNVEAAAKADSPGSYYSNSGGPKIPDHPYDRMTYARTSIEASMEADLPRQSTPERELASPDHSEPYIGRRYDYMSPEDYGYYGRRPNRRMPSGTMRRGFPNMQSDSRYDEVLSDERTGYPVQGSDIVPEDKRPLYFPPDGSTPYPGFVEEHLMDPYTLRSVPDDRDERHPEVENVEKRNEEVDGSPQKFSQALFSTIVTQRALSQKCKEFGKRQQEVEDARLMVQEQEFLERAAIRWKWQERQEISSDLVKLEAELRKRQEPEKMIGRQVKHLQHRADREAQRLRASENHSRGSPELQYLSGNVAFWELFDEFKEASKSIEHIESELKYVERSRDLIDNAVDRNCRLSPASGVDALESFSLIWNPDHDREMAGIPRLYGKLEELNQRREEAIARQRDQWMELAQLADETLSRAGMLEGSDKQAAGPEGRG